MMPEASPFISICIPSYQRIQYLKRLLNSISSQTYRNFEVILSDDSKDDSVQILARQYEEKFPLRYYKNNPSLGTPANWNAGIKKARGEWIKLMHDDDWFASDSSLQSFAKATKAGNKFIVSGYNNIDETGAILRKPALTSVRKKMLVRNPMILLSENVIGQPSVCLVHHSIVAMYDERMKWRVDIDFYIQLLLTEKTVTHLAEVLINLGISSTQVTHNCLNVPGVELPEGWLLLEKYGVMPLKNILVYDAWWRIIRNTHTRSKSTLYQYASPWPRVIEYMVETQSRIDEKRLQKGIFSKLYMLMCYLKSQRFFILN